jgi:hypothetical protein
MGTAKRAQRKHRIRHSREYWQRRNKRPQPLGRELQDEPLKGATRMFCFRHRRVEPVIKTDGFTARLRCRCQRTAGEMVSGRRS